MDENINDPAEEISEYYAFTSLNTISTSFNDGLEKSIIELVNTTDDLYMSDIFERFGNYETVHKQLKKLVLDNKIVLYEMQPGSFENNVWDQQKVKAVDLSVSRWIDLAAQPCLTCSIINECSINNPVSSATCEEFNNWLMEEIELAEDID